MPRCRGEADEAGAWAAAQKERSAVALSLWVGGVGLAALKLVVYLSTGSVLVRASMFESLGDVFSSLIMATIHWKVNDNRDTHRYPMGKGRFAPLGVLFFCAFMCSTMLSMAIESAQSLVAAVESGLAADAAKVTVSAAMQKLFQEKERLRWVYGPRAVQRMIEEYGAAAGAGAAGTLGTGNPGIDVLSMALLGLCFLVKILLFLYCKFVGWKRSSEIVSALACEHRNDTISNSMVMGTMLALHLLQNSAVAGLWLGRIDPAVSLLLSLWIVRIWILKALEQFAVLSDQRAEEADVEAIAQAARSALKGSPFELSATDAYRVGEGCRVQLEVKPTSAAAESERVAALLGAVEGAVFGACSEAQCVDMRLRSLKRPPADASFSWVKEY